MTTINNSINNKLDDFIESTNGIGNESVDVLLELEVIFNVIKRQAGEHSDIRRLASAGAYLAGDKANTLDCWCEGVVNGMKKELQS